MRKKRFEETDSRLTCPSTKPRCAGYVANERWGECRGRRLISYDPERPRKWNRESPEVNMTAACRDQCAAALSRPPRRFGTTDQQTLVADCHAANEVPTPSLIRNHLIQRRDPSISLPRHPDAAIAALEDKFRNRGTPPPAALARIAELEAKRSGGG